jgi:hypothetical protein
VTKLGHINVELDNLWTAANTNLQSTHHFELASPNAWWHNGASTNLWRTPTISFADAATKWAVHTFFFPPQLKTLTSASMAVTVWYLANNVLASKDVVTELSVNRFNYTGNAGTQISTNQQQIHTLSTSAWRSFKHEHTFTGLDLSGTMQGVSIRAERLGSDINDTHADVIHFAGATLVFTDTS